MVFLEADNEAQESEQILQSKKRIELNIYQDLLATHSDYFLSSK